jgi:hypothetical protein
MRTTIPFTNYNNSLSFGFSRPKDEFGLSLSFDSSSEHTISFGVTLPYLFRFYATLNSLRISKISWWKKLLQLEYGSRYSYLLINRDLESVDGGYNICLALWNSDDSSDGGISKFINTNNLIYGDFKLERTILNVYNEKVFIPDAGNYEAEYYDLKITEELYRYTWPRFNRKLTGNRYEVECEKGVPDRIKWGQDYCYSLTFPMGEIQSKDEAIERFIDDIQKTRIKG